MKKRIITGILMALIVFPLLFIGGVPFLIASIALTAVCLYEVTKVKKVSPYISIPLIMATLFFTFFDYATINETFLSYPIYYPVIMTLVLYTIAIFNKDIKVEDVNYLVVMHLVFSIFGRGIIYLRGLNDNANVIFYLILTTMSVDIFAYFIGRKFGKNKLNERISPKKTIEGSIGGIAFGVIIGLLVSAFFPIFTSNNTTPFIGLALNTSFNLPNYLLVIVLTLVLTITAQLGDLMFSLIKRTFKIKDFSNILPGHGGIIDRIDGISFNVIIVSFLHIFLMLFI